MFRLLAATIAAFAVTAPAAVAMHAPGNGTPPTRQSVESSATADQLDARLGPKYIVTPRSTTQPVSTVPAGDSRRWIYPIALVALVAGVLVVRVRRPGKPDVVGAVPSRRP